MFFKPDSIDTALASARNDIDLALKLHHNAEQLQQFFTIANPTKNELGLAHEYAANINNIAGIDDFIAVEALTLDNVKEYGKQAYRFIADFIMKLVGFLKAWFMNLFNRSEGNTERATDALAEFNQALDESDKVIKDLGLVVGKKPTAEDIERINAVGKEVMLNFRGEVVDGSYVRNNMTEMIAAGRRKDPRLAPIADDKSQLSNLKANIEDAATRIFHLSNVGGNNRVFEDVGRKLFNVGLEDDVEWLRINRQKLCHDEFLRVVSELKLRKTRGNEYQAKEIMGIYPTFILSNNGKCEFFTMKFSAVAGAVNADKAKSMNFKFEALSIAQVKELIAVIGDLEAKIKAVAENVNRQNEFMTNLAQGNGEYIASAVEKIRNLIGEKNESLFKELEGEIKKFPNSYSKQMEVHTNSVKMLDAYLQALSYYVDSMLSIKELPTVKKTK
jgi:hypothetical protein